jgi:photosystem II stability/assembly factor-like uncharacterized protein
MTYLPKSELVGVLAPYSINPKDIGNVWRGIGQILAPVDATSTRTLCYIGNGIALAGMTNNSAAGDHILRTVDYAGGIWTDLGIISAGTGRFNDSVYVGTGVVLFVDNAGHVYRSIDFGVNWTDQGAVAGANAIESISYLGNGRVIFCTTNGHIFRSINYGSTWADLGDITGTTNPLRMTAYLENGIAIAGADNQHIYRSTDFGVSWTDLLVVTTEAIRFASFYLGKGIAIITSRAFAVNARIWRSIDFGLTWTNVFTFVGINIFNDGVYLGDGISIIGDARSPGHIFRSIDFGLTWTDLGAVAISGGINKIAYLGNGVTIAGDSGNDLIMNDISYKTDEAEVLIDPSFITTTASITIGQSHNTVNVNAAGGNRVITLESAPLLRIGHEFIIKKIDATTNTVTITPSGGQTIDGAASNVLNIQYQNLIIRTDGTNWYIVSPVIGTLSVLAAMGQLKPNVTRYSQPGWMIVRDDDTITMTGGFIYYIPFFVATTTTFTETVFNVTGAGGGGATMDIRIFAWNDGVPGAQVVNVGTVLTDSAGTKTIAASYTLDRGFYFIAMRNSLAVTVNSINWSFPVSCPVGGTTSTTAASTNFTNFVGATVNSAYADPAPAPTAITIGFPVFKLREN